MRAEQLTDPVCLHAEGPVYSPRWRGVRWVDMLAGDILELLPDGSIDRAHVGDVAAVLRARVGGGLIIAVRRGLAITDDDSLHSPVHALPELWSDENLRMNEGGCDPSGAFYAGSVTYDHTPGAAELWRVGPDLRPQRVLGDVTVSNGLEWSPDGGLAYYVDSVTHRIDVFDWDAVAGFTDRRAFVTIETEAEPDGITVDADGGIWVALHGGSSVRRYTSDGRLDEVIEVPVRQVTAVTFAGPALDQLVITTSRKGLGAQAEPLAGALFAVMPGVHGRAAKEFAA
ncbi:MAG TPA: SMP-30/gluconolactonase/LRE family protein [Lacisediminihabitans sp.]|uniref:SMP-30/gluconolactonase/LRE family protein n=1 Tax=Lacisediminihabitans sp. TaxID=2787631 RepID=UPI002ED9F45C